MKKNLLFMLIFPLYALTMEKNDDQETLPVDELGFLDEKKLTTTQREALNQWHDRREQHKKYIRERLSAVSEGKADLGNLLRELKYERDPANIMPMFVRRSQGRDVATKLIGTPDKKDLHEKDIDRFRPMLVPRSQGRHADRQKFPFPMLAPRSQPMFGMRSQGLHADRQKLGKLDHDQQSWD